MLAALIKASNWTVQMDLLRCQDKGVHCRKVLELAASGTITARLRGVHFPRGLVFGHYGQSTEDLIAYAYDCCVFRDLMPEEREQFGLPEGGK